MTKNSFPVFRKWARELFRWKKAIVVAIGVVGGHAIAENYLKRYYSVVEPCEQPCQDALSCDPLEFSFEVLPSKIKLNQRNSLWYRARLKNRSCRQLGGLYVDGFVDAKELRKLKSGLWVTVSDPNGREIERHPIPGPDGGIVWNYGDEKGSNDTDKGTIYPYQPNFKLLEELRKSKKLRESNFIDLRPGEIFETIAPVLRPYRIAATSIRTEDGGLSDGYRWIEVKNPPSFPSPPVGFNLLDRYIFDRPGRYTISAGYDEKISIRPIYKRWENEPAWLALIFRNANPPDLKSVERDVSLTAPPAVIEVR